MFNISDSCPSPPVLAHGSHNGNDYSNGRNVTYSCDPQYALEGSTVIACLDGQWIGEVPVCRGNLIGNGGGGVGGWSIKFAYVHKLRRLIRAGTFN